MKKSLIYTICLVGAMLLSCKPNEIAIEEEREEHNWNPESESYIPKGALNHLFSVSPTQKVLFSKGNLQYTIPQPTAASSSGGEFRFADKQEDPKQTSVSLDGENSILEYFPYGATGARYTRPNSLNGLPTKDICQTEFDWGEYCPISNAENLAGFWRTLTLKEWEYLLNKRTNADSLNCIVIYNGVTGLMLLPDDFTTAAFAKPIFTKKSGDNYYYNDNYPRKKEYYVNNLSKVQYDNLVQLGAVFLPFGSRRVLQDGSPCEYYWTSTFFGDRQACAIQMQPSHLNEGALIITSTGGLARVRLVQDYPVERYAMTYSKSPATKHKALFNGTSITLEMGESVYFAIYDKERRKLLNSQEMLNAIGKSQSDIKSKWTIEPTSAEQILNVKDKDGTAYQTYFIGCADAYMSGDNAKYKVTYSVVDKDGKTVNSLERTFTVTVTPMIIN